ncbi:hypothetical protein CKM354_000608400 [Cercospora kikuchii]|uniref:2EXR domain-containing protein n=1 Tax=Cercospora kikuchii TaxID=84275 RepID=A0A9P3CLS9_9PEZI|nr:uncharacterized protein CKM354_000608400 [Cercospora kikuchii]GIZ42830.1 hypothetical protein CKM354_000608400 [Cercospora kikuchii]
MAALKKVDPSIPVEGCHIFNKLPGEMRNKIWELSFTNIEQVVDLECPSPPTKSLLLTCKKINSEARGLYQDAYRAYWTTSPFQITITSQEYNEKYNETRRRRAVWDDSPEYQTLLRHRRDITDVTVVLLCTEREKVFKCVRESMFLDEKGICKASIKLKSNFEAHWKGHTEYGLHCPRVLSSEVADTWLQEMQDKSGMEARLYMDDEFRSMDREVEIMLRRVRLEDVLRRLDRFRQV